MAISMHSTYPVKDSLVTAIIFYIFESHLRSNEGLPSQTEAFALIK